MTGAIPINPIDVCKYFHLAYNFGCFIKVSPDILQDLQWLNLPISSSNHHLHKIGLPILKARMSTDHLSSPSVEGRMEYFSTKQKPKSLLPYLYSCNYVVWINPNFPLHNKTTKENQRKFTSRVRKKIYRFLKLYFIVFPEEGETDREQNNQIKSHIVQQIEGGIEGFCFYISLHFLWHRRKWFHNFEGSTIEGGWN